LAEALAAAAAARGLTEAPSLDAESLCFESKLNYDDGAGGVFHTIRLVDHDGQPFHTATVMKERPVVYEPEVDARLSVGLHVCLLLACSHVFFFFFLVLR
jgi:hypothetical protein